MTTEEQHVSTTPDRPPVDIDHYIPGPWHTVTVSPGVDAPLLVHPGVCGVRCNLSLRLADDAAQLASLGVGEYRLRWTPRGMEVQYADGTDLPGRRPLRPDPIVPADAQVDALVTAADEALNAYEHLRQCGCVAWPETCLTEAYAKGGGLWDSGAWWPALPGILAAWEQMRPVDPELARLRTENAQLRAALQRKA